MFSTINVIIFIIKKPMELVVKKCQSNLYRIQIIFVQNSINQTWINLGINMVKTLFFKQIYDEIVRIKFDENVGIQALIPALQSQLVIFTKSLFIIGKYSQF